MFHDFDHEGSTETNDSSTGGRYPVRERGKPGHFKDFVNDSGECDGNNFTIDYCYRAMCSVQNTHFKTHWSQLTQNNGLKQWTNKFSHEKKTTHLPLVLSH